ncbi:MAG: 4-hydroxy-tetrahydrodipicolinate synthase [Bacteroidia bacterium]|nr:4-hydroxy-tetrahydrodipicolinate synthase [Bacteroidia bacterium]NNF30273.1 4-hydroxy-tetrahydrodipicolinate synthase [Flavobacteriaceae bacterium]MBT8277344.1 4-hydroxy-tetrahydrodipicolinate synthase [Bacteroidia bacterium]NNJ81588.1 4-hydroxy-tetrahydrodipicolinate synthase [Flavobacteriaceae bacterium]NNK54280.1 4-hydroxy-tetrahydrodipicolinate synthase [Flavobacteriaceae bacterium]
MKELTGTGVALITPFKEDNSLDVDGLTRVVNYQIENGIDYLVLLGTTAESATLSNSEKQLVIETVTSANARRLPMVLGIGGNNTQAVIDEVESRNLEDFTAILSVSPMYNKPTQEGIYQHFAAIAAKSPKPIIVYNVPSRTGSNVLPETISWLARDFNNIVAIKEAAGDIVQAMRMIDSTPDDFMVISGDDMVTLPMILAGGSGVISVIGEGFPRELSKMVQLGLAGNASEAHKIHYQMMPAIDYIFAEGNPAGIKAVFKALGICDEFVRLPLVSASSSLKARINDFVAQNS